MNAPSMLIEAARTGVPGRRTARCEPLLADDPWWLMLIKALLIFIMLLLLTLFAIWFERRSSAGCSTGPARTGTARSACCSRWPTR